MKVHFKNTAFIDGVRYRPGVQEYNGDPAKLPSEVRKQLEADKSAAAAPAKEPEPAKSDDKAKLDLAKK